MAARQIHCIVTESDRFGERRITGLRGRGWSLTVEEAFEAIRSGEVFFATLEGQSYSVVVGTAKDGRKFLRTALGEDNPAMLLRLRECPA